MHYAIPLALAGSLCTATSSVCQRLGAKNSEATRVDVGLIFRLARRPIWLAGLASQILGFAFQMEALRYGALALVQPIFALELLFVFAYMNVLGTKRVTRRDWLAAAAMTAGLGVLLLAASPSGGRPHAPASLWWLAGLLTVAAVVTGLAIAFGLHRRSPASARRRAVVLGAVTGIAWGFVAAVIKEFSSHLGQGLGPIVGTWSLYVLIGAGAASLLLASHALAAGPLAASQPGFTILDPLAAGLLGLFLFGEHIQTATAQPGGRGAGGGAAGGRRLDPESQPPAGRGRQQAGRRSGPGLPERRLSSRRGRRPAGRGTAHGSQSPRVRSG